MVEAAALAFQSMLLSPLKYKKRVCGINDRTAYRNVGPDFLGIGATRGGSSWLHHVLSTHPDVWLTPVKELHYFDRPAIGSRTLWVQKKRAIKSLKLLWTASWKQDNRLSTVLQWELRYLLGRRSDQWYRRLFVPANGRLAGEITPAYAVLDKEVIGQIRDHNPEIRAVYIIRDPIERGWSGIVNDLAKGRRRSIADVSMKEMMNMIHKPHFLARSNYAENIRNWRAIVGEDRLFVGFFEDVRLQPHALLDDMCSFLGIRGSEALLEKERLYGIRNESSRYSTPMPDEVALQLARTLRPMIEDLRQLLGSHASSWLHHADQILAKGRAV